MKKMEVLAPAGSFDTFQKVINAGADAVYLGGNMFGARAYANNFGPDEVVRALDYAHIRGKKIHMTVNTLLKNRELEERLYDYLLPYYEHGLDAVIVQDMGVVDLIRRHFPKMEIHASTQMSVTSPVAAAHLKSLGLTRVVPAREISAAEVKAIHDQVDIELECFVHGALCYCYSGQCLMSSILGGRSGNRGRCAQPCRLAYDVKNSQGKLVNGKDRYPLSMKDLCTIDHLPLLQASGANSLKIEGRMKQSDYAAGVTSVYRKYVDLLENEGPENYKVSQADYKYLVDLGNRSGFTKGYYEQHNGRDMLSISNSSHSGAKELQVPKDLQEYCASAKKHLISGNLTAVSGQPMYLTVYDDLGHEVSLEGPVVDQAQKRPMTAEDLKQRLQKTGDTPFTFTNLDVYADDNIFVPVQAMNQLRRDALTSMERQILKAYNRKGEDFVSFETFQKKIATETVSDILKTSKRSISSDAVRGFRDEKQLSLTVEVFSKEQLQEVVKYPYVSNVILRSYLLDDVNKVKTAGKSAFLKLPEIFRLQSQKEYDRKLEKYKNVLDGITFSSLDGAAWAKAYVSANKLDWIVVAEAGAYAWSDRAMKTYEDLFAHNQVIFAAPYELNQKEFAHRDNANSEFLVYGRLPVMTSAQCLWKSTDGCVKNDKQEIRSLVDRYFKEFLITRNCKDCYNVIYNSQPQMLYHQAKPIKTLGFCGFRMNFLEESGKEAAAQLSFFEKAFVTALPVSSEDYQVEFTNGHFKRGVE